MAKLVPDNVGAQSQDGINAKVGIEYLIPNRITTPLSEKIISGEIAKGAKVKVDWIAKQGIFSWEIEK